MLRGTFLTLSQSTRLRDVATSMALAQRVARRFVAGETQNEAINVVRTVNGKGMLATLDHLGENVSTRAEAVETAEEYLKVLETIRRAGVKSNVSLKLTAMGLDQSTDLAYENLRRVVAKAQSDGNFVRVDMESSDYLDRTLELYYRLRDEGFDNVGVVIQSYLYRSEADVKALIERGGNIRLVKGAYDEPASVAFPSKADTDANFIALMKLMLSPEAREKGAYLAVASHDENMIRATQAYAAEQRIPPDRYEFQMLYGIRSGYQEELTRAGHKFRVYVPYGQAWYPYFMRRLAERPANVIFLLKNLVR